MTKRARPDSPSDQPAQSGKRQKRVRSTINRGPSLPDDLASRLRAAERRTPRFLFRAWHNDEDSKCASTTTYVKPGLRLQDSEDPMYQLSKETLAKYALAHLQGRPEPSIFSDWTHSPSTALEKIPRSLMSETHLAVVDTSRLPLFITILHSSAFASLNEEIREVPGTEHIFLAYGVIQSDCYRAVSLAPFLDANRPSLLLEQVLDPRPETIDPLREFKLAQRFARSFGENFELLVLATMLASYTYNGDVLNAKDRLEGLAWMLEDYQVPIDWKSDYKILLGNGISHGFKDVERTRRLMHVLVLQRYGIFDVDDGFESTETEYMARESSSAEDSADGDFELENSDE